MSRRYDLAWSLLFAYGECYRLFTTMKEGLFVSCMRAIDDSVGGGGLEGHSTQEYLVMFTATQVQAR
jgi:hypothetical protein